MNNYANAANKNKEIPAIVLTQENQNISQEVIDFLNDFKK